MKVSASLAARFFGVFLRAQTYLNLLYLVLSFPLGLAYFIILTVGLTAGLGLAILWVGLLLLVAVFAAWYALLAFERWLAITLLREDIPAMQPHNLSGLSLWQKFVATAKNPVTWKGLLYLLARFPLGLLIFIIVVTLGALSLSLLAAPLYYSFVQPQIVADWGPLPLSPIINIDTLSKALLASLLGVPLTLISLHIFNGLAWVSAKFARVMLGNFTSPASSAAPPAETAPTLPATETAQAPTPQVPQT